MGKFRIIMDAISANYSYVHDNISCHESRVLYILAIEKKYSSGWQEKNDKRFIAYSNP